MIPGLIKVSASRDSGGEKSAPDSKEILNMKSLGGWLADYMSPGAWGGERAGRAQSMANASGRDTSFSIRHPTTSTAVSSLGGGVLGGLAGVGLGTGISLMAGGSPYTVGRATALSGLGGAVFGGTYGAVKNLKSRRSELKDISREYDIVNQMGDLDPKAPEFSELASWLAPLRGPHRTGQEEAYEAMTGGDSIGDSHGLLRDALYAGSGIGIRTSGIPIAGLAHRYGQNIKTQTKSDVRKKDREKKSMDYTPGSISYDIGREMCRSGVMLKQAGLADYLKNPGVRSAIGAVGGAGLGYGAGMLYDTVTGKKKHNAGRNLALAAMGAGVGGVGGYYLDDIYGVGKGIYDRTFKSDSTNPTDGLKSPDLKLPRDFRGHETHETQDTPGAEVSDRSLNSLPTRNESSSKVDPIGISSDISASRRSRGGPEIYDRTFKGDSTNPTEYGDEPPETVESPDLKLREGSRVRNPQDTVAEVSDRSLNSLPTRNESSSKVDPNGVSSDMSVSRRSRGGPESPKLTPGNYNDILLAQQGAAKMQYDVDRLNKMTNDAKESLLLVPPGPELNRMTTEWEVKISDLRSEIERGRSKAIRSYKARQGELDKQDESNEQAAQDRKGRDSRIDNAGGIREEPPAERSSAYRPY